MADKLAVLISSYLAAEDVSVIEASDSRLRVLYRPDLVPSPRYEADHGGAKPVLTDRQESEWADLLAQADIAFDFDWQSPERLGERAPKLKWVQATSAGVGGFMKRTGLQDTDLVVTTAGRRACRSARRVRRHRRPSLHQGDSRAGPPATRAPLGEVHHGAVGRSYRHRRWPWRNGATDRRGVPRSGNQSDRGGPARPGIRPAAGVRRADSSELSAVLPETDVLVLCCPLTPRDGRARRGCRAGVASGLRRPGQHLPRAGGRRGCPDRGAA